MPRLIEQVGQHQRGQSEPDTQVLDVRGHLDQPRSPWLTSQEACSYLRFAGPGRLRSLYRFLKAQGIPVVHRSPKRLLIARADLDQALRGPSAVRRRNRVQAA